MTELTQKQQGPDQTKAQIILNKLPWRIRLAQMKATYWSSIVIHEHILKPKNDYIILGCVASGTNWLTNTVAAYSDIPAFKNWQVILPQTEPHVFHMHRFLQSEFAKSRTLYMARDGRDVVVSVFHKYAKALREDRDRKAFRRATGIEISSDLISEQFPAFLEWYISTPQRSSIPWPEHIMRGLDEGYVRIHFEAFKADAIGELRRAIQELDGGEPDHERLAAAVASRDISKVRTQWNSHFLRKGTSGEWKKLFDQRSREIFAEWGGEALKRAGYETSDDWVTDPDASAT
jgi:hypothetical protein